MIRLIATDMDGTLLKDNKTVSNEIYEVMNKMFERNIYFCAASGRQYQSLLALFESNEHTFFIAENGAYVVYQGKELYSSIIEPILVRDILHTIDTIGHAEAMLCAKQCSYTTNPITAKVMSDTRFHYNIKLVESLYEVKEDIIKVSMVEQKGMEGRSYEKLIELLGERAKMAVSGYNCIDIVNKGVSKGTAIEMIQKQYKIDFEETMVFGDNYNDVEMFQKAYYSYAMKNAQEAVQKQARFITGYNNENGVINEIKNRLNL